MLHSEILDKTVDVFGRVLGESAFIIPELIEDNSKPALEEWDVNGVILAFSGHCRGSVSLWAGNEFMQCIAVNILGLEEETPGIQDKALDAVKEMLNIIVGNLLTTVYGDEPIFDLGIPEVLSREQVMQEYDSEKAIWLEAEGYPVLIVVNIEPDDIQ